VSAPDRLDLESGHGLWSLWDMLKDNAADFVAVGELIASAAAIWGLHADHTDEGYLLNEVGQKLLHSDLQQMMKLAQRLGLPTSTRLIGRRLNRIPTKEEEFDVITEVLKDELDSKLFLFVPNERAPFWEKGDLLSEKARAAFPNADAELRLSGNAYAAALPEGSVYYSMRALEHSLAALAKEVDRNFDVQNWQNIINEIEAQITDWRKNGIPGMEKAAKDNYLQFLSEAAKEFAYFKDGWRNYAAHAKVPYNDHQAITVLKHVVDFTERLSERLAEVA